MNLFEDKNLFHADMEGVVEEAKNLLTSLESLMKLKDKVGNFSPKEVEEIKFLANKIDCALVCITTVGDNILNNVVDSFIQDDECATEKWIAQNENMFNALEAKQELIDKKYNVDRSESNFSCEKCDCFCHLDIEDFDGDDDFDGEADKPLLN